MATGACSLDEPHPKLLPPIIIGYCVFISPGSTYLRKAYMLHSVYGIREAALMHSSVDECSLAQGAADSLENLYTVRKCLTA